ncbi:MAG: hypothetical protein COV72_07910 [Candidatus Omnitrophica bacterium CG11_big_fil_rev_8_21_14_0_20_42_13]|uniref:Phosphatidylglycerol lysyltransferase C-terminal domain-containing protein n=1 Tax=Candidatus Ghiorseimicrobium undicola TaxID=1974746 RepID=A0A2H0LVX1_9BACT|nr:MAG: hypothetical protein COV72_07910 [Candidatus Omnitrophica bacterium CG11_big_fil_rev_8_21_14_0_20_42_13]
MVSAKDQEEIISKKIKQFVPESACLKCEGCCRFNGRDTVWAPCERKVVPFQDYFICSLFSPLTRRCKSYDSRLLDCRIYPFLIHKKEKSVYLTADLKCPYLNERLQSKEYEDYARYLFNFLNSADGANLLSARPGLAVEYDEELKIIGKIEKGNFLGSPLAFEDKIIFDAYIQKSKHEISAHSFANIYVWRTLFDVRFNIIKEHLCVFFKDELGCFMYLPALGGRADKDILNYCFDIMDGVNADKDTSRVENIEEKDKGFYEDNGFKLLAKDPEYIYHTQDLITLCGDKFKDKRASCNYFQKNYKYSYEDLSQGAVYECLQLLAQWRKERLSKAGSNSKLSDIKFYSGILDDNCLAQEEALLNFDRLNLEGKIIRVEGKVAAYTFGFALSEETFCIFSEVADLNIKGIAQFIFRQFCSDLKKYRYINVMDDSGLKNLKDVKDSYNPARKVCLYTARKV